MAVLTQKYHLPHNAIRIDEFNFMLECIDLNKEFYSYKELRLLFLKEQIKQDVLKIFHKKYDSNLKEHLNLQIREIYTRCINNPTDENLNDLLNCQYSKAKTFKQIFNETTRDYTEFFAFLGLLPTYYKGKAGGENKHFVSERLREYRKGEVSLEQLILDFKYRNSSKNYEVLDMYSISVRPYLIALRACYHYFNKGFTRVNNKIISAIVLYAQNENIDYLLSLFKDPTKSISEYKKLFNKEEFEAIEKELGRATLQLSPYLLHTGYLKRENSFYMRGDKEFNESCYAKKVAFCNSCIGNLTITPVVGKIIYNLYKFALNGKKKVSIDSLFDHNVNIEDKSFLIKELIELDCVSIMGNNLIINPVEKQIAINPYSDFFDISDSNYVANITSMNLYSEPMFVEDIDISIDSEFELIRPIALGSNGAKYEESIYELIKTHFGSFSAKWYGASSTGKRVSDIFIRTKVKDGMEDKNIAIIIECKAGNAVRAFDERKEWDDILNTLSIEKANGTIDGIWYWVVNGNSLPSVDEHGGYRQNSLSKSFVEKLSELQFNISEYMRVPTIVTAFSFEAIKNYISYLFDKIGDQSCDVINKIDVPHFWRWSKKFMNLQYVMVHKELRLNA